MAGKTALLILAHEESGSFNKALHDTAVSALKQQGYKVLISDLYQQNFRPTISRTDINGTLQNPDHFNYVTEIGNAYQNNALCDDIRTEMDKVAAADLVIFQFPMQWFSVPAILKGWFDRVLTTEFAFKFPQIMDNGLLKGKKAMLSFTTGSPGGFFSSSGLMGDLNAILWPIQYGTLRFCGFDVLRPQCSFCPGFADVAQRKAMLGAWETRLLKIHSEKPIAFPSVTNFDPQRFFSISEETIKKLQNNKYGLSVAHHMGKQVRLDSDK